MKFYAILYDDKIVQGMALDERSLEAVRETLEEGHNIVEADFMPDPFLHYWDGQSLISKPDSPGGGYFWDDRSLSYEYDIATGFSILRSERDAKLQSSDWTQVPDAPVDQAAWATYRQALRDLPENTDDPRQVVWPEEP